MEFNIKRTSTGYLNDESIPPCAGARIAREYEEDMMTPPWFTITINSLEELIQLVKENGSIIIEQTEPKYEFFETEGIVEEFIIEVYDGHRE